MSETTTENHQEVPGEKGVETQHQEQASSINHHGQRVVHADGHVDMIDDKAVGGELDAMPKGYYRSIPFVMTFIVSTTHIN